MLNQIDEARVAFCHLYCEANDFPEHFVERQFRTDNAANSMQQVHLGFGMVHDGSHTPAYAFASDGVQSKFSIAPIFGGVTPLQRQVVYFDRVSVSLPAARNARNISKVVRTPSGREVFGMPGIWVCSCVPSIRKATGTCGPAQVIRRAASGSTFAIS